MTRAVPLVTALLVLSVPAGAGAATLPSSVDVMTDGEAVAVIASGSSGRLVPDGQPLDGGPAVMLSGGCYAFGGVGAGRILAQCLDRVEVNDTATGVWRVPAGNEAIQEHLRSRFRGESYQLVFDGVGSRLARLRFSSGQASGHELVDLETGAVIEPTRSAVRYETLDSSSGWAPLCAPVRRQRRVAVDQYGNRDLDPQDAIQVGPWVVRWSEGRNTVLQHCGSARAITLARRPNSPPVLTRRYVAWVTERTVHVRRLATGRTQTMRLPKPRSRPVRYDIAATAHRLFVRCVSDVRARWRVFELP